MTGRKYPVPEGTKADAAHAAARGVLSLIPWAGGPFVEVFQAIVQPPLDKRRNEWMATVGEALQRLERQGLKIDDLQSNEQFISAVMQASQIAVRTHQEEKIDALRNAVCNIAAGWSPGETELHLFLGLVDTMTPAHLRMLKAVHDQATDFKNLRLMMSLPAHVAKKRGSPTLDDVLWKQLEASGLVENLKDEAGKTTRIPSTRVTPIGRRFLRFISPDAIAKPSSPR
jgi:hypothetical protein